MSERFVVKVDLEVKEAESLMKSIAREINQKDPEDQNGADEIIELYRSDFKNNIVEMQI